MPAELIGHNLNMLVRGLDVSKLEASGYLVTLLAEMKKSNSQDNDFKIRMTMIWDLPEDRVEDILNILTENSSDFLVEDSGIIVYVPFLEQSKKMAKVRSSSECKDELKKKVHVSKNNDVAIVTKKCDDKTKVITKPSTQKIKKELFDDLFSCIRDVWPKDRQSSEEKLKRIIRIKLKESSLDSKSFFNKLNQSIKNYQVDANGNTRDAQYYKNMYKFINEDEWKNYIEADDEIVHVSGEEKKESAIISQDKKKDGLVIIKSMIKGLKGFLDDQIKQGKSKDEILDLFESKWEDQKKSEEFNKTVHEHILNQLNIIFSDKPNNQRPNLSEMVKYLIQSPFSLFGLHACLDNKDCFRYEIDGKTVYGSPKNNAIIDLGIEKWHQVYEDRFQSILKDCEQREKERKKQEEDAEWLKRFNGKMPSELQKLEWMRDVKYKNNRHMSDLYQKMIENLKQG